MSRGISSVIDSILIAIISLSFISAVYFFLGGFSNSITTNLIFSTVSCSSSEILVYIENTGTIPAQNIIVKKDGSDSCAIPLIDAGRYGYCKIESMGNTGMHNLTARENDKTLSAEINCTSQGTATILTTTTTTAAPAIQTRQSITISSSTASQTITTTTQSAATQTTTSQATNQTTTQTVTTTSLVQTTTTSAPSSDTTPPTTSILCNSATCSSTWYGSDITVSLSCSDTGSGCNPNTSPGYCFDQTGVCNINKLYVGTFIISTEGVNYVRYNSTDNAGNMEMIHVQALDLDKTAPTSSILCNSATCSTGSYSSAVTVSLSCSDFLSGCAANNPLYCVDQTNTCTPSTSYSSSFSVSTQGSNYVRFSSTDAAGNAETTNSQVINIGSSAWGSIQIQPSSPSTQDTVNFTAWKSGTSPTLSSIKIFVNSQKKKTCSLQPVSVCTYLGGPYAFDTTVTYYAVFTDLNLNTYQTTAQFFTILR